MADQQGKALDLAWLAGFIDGEGSIMFRVQRGKRLTNMGLLYYYPAVRICNTHEPSLQTVCDILDANGLAYHVSRRNDGHRYNRVATWDVEVKGLKRVKRWLEVIAPYLRTKHEKARLMLEFISSRELRDVADGYTDREIAIIQALRNAPIHPHRLHAEAV